MEQGKSMRDTVELLEAIGRDAELRRASPDALAEALAAAGASAGLRELVAQGDATTLVKELGLTQMHVEHQSQTGGHEGDDRDDGDDDEGGEDEPARQPGDARGTPPA
jgi:hypothetical protein